LRFDLDFADLDIDADFDIDADLDFGLAFAFGGAQIIPSSFMPSGSVKYTA
jgi:hypothetical protein